MNSPYLLHVPGISFEFFIDSIFEDPECVCYKHIFWKTDFREIPCKKLVSGRGAKGMRDPINLQNAVIAN